MTGSLSMIGFGLSVIGAALGIGMIFTAALNGMARQPEAGAMLRTTAIIGAALAEALAIMGIGLAFALN